MTTSLKEQLAWNLVLAKPKIQIWMVFQIKKINVRILRQVLLLMKKAVLLIPMVMELLITWTTALLSQD